MRYTIQIVKRAKVPCMCARPVVRYSLGTYVNGKYRCVRYACNWCLPTLSAGPGDTIRGRRGSSVPDSCIIPREA